MRQTEARREQFLYFNEHLSQVGLGIRIHVRRDQRPVRGQGPDMDVVYILYGGYPADQRLADLFRIKVLGRALDQDMNGLADQVACASQDQQGHQYRQDRAMGVQPV